MGAKKPGHKTAVHEEIQARRIELKDSLDKMKWYPVMDLLKIDKLKLMSARPGGASLSGKAMTYKDVKDIIPQTDGLKALLPAQNTWQAEKRRR